jgi:CDP-glucose 4,6-dehydratase
MGTINILEILKKIKKKCSVVLITSDKCYRNKEWLWGYREIDELGGIDPYSASKAATEIAIRSYSQSFFQTSQSNIRLGSARAGNVIGGGDWSKDRLLPDCIKSWSQDKTVILRNPSSTRPWQHVLEPLSGYIWLASKLDEDDSFNGESFNFGPMDTEPQTVLSVVNEISKHWKKVSWEIQQDETAHESGLLKLNCDKANQLLNWQSVLSFKKTIQITSEWYKEFYNEKLNMKDFTKYQIEEYMKLANEKNIEWAL